MYLLSLIHIFKNIETAQVFEKSEVKVWECRNCGHIVVGTKAVSYTHLDVYKRQGYVIQSSYSFVDESNRLVCPTSNNHVLMLKATDLSLIHI